MSNEIKTDAQKAMLEGLQRKSTNKIVLLYSGGADSTATGIMLRESGKEVDPLFIDYGQTAREAEEMMVTYATSLLGFNQPKIVRTDVMAQISKSDLLGGKAEDDSQAWVPGRNSLFMMLAGIYAQQINADGVAIGFMLEDTGVFGDSNFLHHKTMELLLAQTLSRPMEVIMPLMAKSKKEVLELLEEKGALDLTVSCWNATVENGKVVTCHQCANCIERESNLKNTK